ncbi:MAG: gliding motility-associated C-terminal domain-containing protein [Saprospiraceae bacterium]
MDYYCKCGGGQPPFTYSLNGGGFTTSGAFSALGAGILLLQVEDADGCLLEEEVVLPDGNEVVVDLGEDQRIRLGETADIYPWVSIDSIQIARLDWQTVATLPCSTCLVQRDLALTASTQFFLTVTDENGCEAADNVTIFVEKYRGVYVPNVFSPNGDGINDIFYIFSDNQSVAQINTLQIFDRWGEHIFQRDAIQPNDPTVGWDGKWRETTLNPAVFVWVAEILFKDGDVILLKGDVSLVK